MMHECKVLNFWEIWDVTEGLNLQSIPRLHTILPWYTDPAKIRERQEVAHGLAFWADVGVFTLSLIAFDSESDY